MECKLCDLTNHEIVYQDNDCFAMVIKEPLKDYHLMVLPKRHVASLADLTPVESVAILNLLGLLGKIMSQVDSDDPIIFMNTGKHSTQAHIHFHILPSKGGLRELFSTYEKIPFRREGTKEELKQIGNKVREILNT